MARLTFREQEVLELISIGLSCRQLAAALQISPYTVRKHRSNILTKLGLHSTAQLIACAVDRQRGSDSPAPPAEAFADLTPRERQVATLIVRGLTSKQIARELGISPGTVRKHRDNIARRAGLHSVTDFILRTRTDTP